MSGVPLTDVTARYHGGDEFSAEAFEQTPEQRRRRDRARIERSIREDGPATCEALEERLGLSHQTCSARISEMRRGGDLVEVGRAATRSGRSARVHQMADLVAAESGQG